LRKHSTATSERPLIIQQVGEICTNGPRGLMLYPYTALREHEWRIGHKAGEKSAYPQGRHSGAEQAL
jgi:hypothetical protein